MIYSGLKVAFWVKDLRIIAGSDERQYTSVANENPLLGCIPYCSSATLHGARSIARLWTGYAAMLPINWVCTTVTSRTETLA